MKPEHAKALLAVTAAPALIHADGTHRRIQALVERGWSVSKIAALLGMEVANLFATLQRDQITAAKARTIATLYREIADTPPPASTAHERAAVTRARNYAATRGWLPPAAWDDDLIDLPAPELAAEIDRQVNAMDDDELRRANNARKRGERSPVLVAAAKAWRTRVEPAA